MWLITYNLLAYCAVSSAIYLRSMHTYNKIGYWISAEFDIATWKQPQYPYIGTPLKLLYLR